MPFEAAHLLLIILIVTSTANVKIIDITLYKVDHVTFHNSYGWHDGVTFGLVTSIMTNCHSFVNQKNKRDSWILLPLTVLD